MPIYGRVISGDGQNVGEDKDAVAGLDIDSITRYVRNRDIEDCRPHIAVEVGGNQAVPNVDKNVNLSLLYTLKIRQASETDVAYAVSTFVCLRKDSNGPDVAMVSIKEAVMDIVFQIVL